MGCVEIAIAQATKSANNTVKVADGFDSNFRNNDVNSFVIGDEFDIPVDFTGKVMRNYFSPNDPDPVEAKRHSEYIYVDCNGVAKQFYPSCLTKTAFIVDHTKNDGVTIDRLKAGGNVAARYKRTSDGVQGGMDLLKGLHCKVRDVQTVWIRSRFGAHANEDVQTTVLTIDCAELDEKGMKQGEVA